MGPAAVLLSPLVANVFWVEIGKKEFGGKHGLCSVASTATHTGRVCTPRSTPWGEAGSRRAGQQSWAPLIQSRCWCHRACRAVG